MNEDVYKNLKHIDLEMSKKGLLENLIHNANLLKSAGAVIKAYPVGFLRLPFVKNRSEPGYFLHVWRNDIPWTEFESLHTHIFDMESRVLSGEIKNTLWKVTPDKNGGHMMCKGTYEKNRMILKEENRVKVDKLREETIFTDQIYYVRKDDFHSSTAKKGVVTLILKQNVQPEKDPLVVLPINTKTQEGGFDSAQIEQSEAWHIIEESLRKIATEIDIDGN